MIYLLPHAELHSNNHSVVLTNAVQLITPDANHNRVIPPTGTVGDGPGPGPGLVANRPPWTPGQAGQH